MTKKNPSRLKFDDKPVEPTSDANKPIFYTKDPKKKAEIDWPELKGTGIRIISTATNKHNMI